MIICIIISMIINLCLCVLTLLLYHELRINKIDTDLRVLQLEKRVEHLRNNINKAIKYVKNFDYYIPEDNKPDLLKILKN